MRDYGKLLTKPMATNPYPEPLPEERPLTREEGFELLESLYGVFRGKFEEFGGPEAFYRAEQEAWDESPEASQGPHPLTAPVYCK